MFSNTKFFRNLVEVEKIAIKPLWHPIIGFEKLMDLEQSKVYGGTIEGTRGIMTTQNLCFMEKH